MTDTQHRPSPGPPGPPGPPGHPGHPGRIESLEEPVDIFDGKGWWSLVTPFKPARPGTMPAGLVLAVMLFGMVLAMFVNADATLRKSNAKCADCWRHTVAEAVSFASGPFTEPRTALDELRGSGSATGTEDSSELALARKREEDAAAAAAAGGAIDPALGTPTIAAPTRPVVRTPTPADPLKLWVGGDSITGAFGPQLQKVVVGTELFTAVSDSKPSSGLTRPDYFDWPKHLYEDVVKKQDPDVMVIMFGANDSQAMPIRGNQGYARFSPEWMAEYRTRVGDTMDLLQSRDNDRLVVWMGAPIMGPFAGVEGMDKLNHIYWSEAQSRPWIVYFDTASYLSNPDGSYAASLPNAAGETQLLRASDNIHLNSAGADRVAWAVLSRMAKDLDLTAVPIEIPPESSAPASIVERTEVPEPSG